MHLAVVARMLFRAPVVGLKAFLMATPWLVPVYFGTTYAVGAAENGTFAEMNRALIAGIDALLEGNTSWRVPAWVDPMAWLPLIGAAIVWLFFAQRSAMRLSGIVRAPLGMAGLARNFAEWTASALLLPLAGLVVFAGGFLIMTVHEFAWPWHLPSVPSMPDLFATPVEDFGRGLLNDYLGVPLALLFACVSPVVLGARYMGLHAAFADGSNQGGSVSRLLMMVCMLISTALFYPVAAGVMWVISAPVGAEGSTGFGATLGTVWALHFALMWCALSAAAGFAAQREVERSLQEAAEVARRNEIVPIGVIAEELYGEEGAGDDLARRLRAFEARQLARQAA